MTWALESLKNLCFNWLLVTKGATKLFELQNFREIIFYDTEEICRFWRKTALRFEKNLRNLANFHQSTWKCQNWDFVGILLSKVEKVWPYNLQLCMTMKNNAKFEEELTCHFKTNLRNLTNFDSSTRKSKQIAL